MTVWEIVTQLGEMYAWATPEYLLYHMSLQQWSKYYNGGWESRKTNANMFWGILGTLLSGSKNGGNGASEKIIDPGEITLDKVKLYYPDARYENGKIVHS